MSKELKRAIKQVGLTKLARRLGVRPNVLDHWRNRGIPAKRVLALERETGISRHVLRPDLYPREAA